MTIASLLSHLVVRSWLFYKINEKKIPKKINNDLAIVASQFPGGAIHDRKHIANFLIEFMALVAKAQTDNQHAIFLLKRNVNREIIRAILAYLPKEAPQTLEQWKVAITAVGQGYE